MTATERTRKWRKNRQRAGLCINCGKKRGKKYAHRCIKCQAKFRTYLKKWRAARKAKPNGHTRTKAKSAR